MKVLLVVPRYARKPGRYYDYPLGLAYIASAIKGAGHEVVPLNLNPLDVPTDEAVTRAVAEHAPDVCAAGTLSPFMPQLATIFSAARLARPDIVTIAGGGAVSGDPELALASLDLDYGVIGEGEETVAELLDTLERGRDPGAVPGIVFRAPAGHPVMTERRPIIHDIDSIAWPDYDALGFDAYLDAQTRADSCLFHTEAKPRSVPMVASRSCVYSCTFCFHPSGRVYRQRSLDALFAEIDHIVARYHPTTLNFMDELFAASPERILEFCERVKPYGLEWLINLHVHAVDASAMRAMRDAGCAYVVFGLENTHTDILKSMHKKTEPVEIERALADTSGNSIGIRANIIFGDPAETLETANHNMEWWSRNRHLQVDLLCLQVMPGSEVYRKAVADGVFGDADVRYRDRLINVSGIDDESVRHMRLKLMVFQQTILLPAKILRFEEQPDPHPTRGAYYTIEAVCPHCGATSTFDDLLVDLESWFQTIRLTCCSCRGHLHIRNMARRPWVDAETDRLHAEASALGGLGRRAEAIAALRRIRAIPYPPDESDRPRGHVKALFDLGTLLRESETAPHEAVFHLGEALLLNAWDPSYHMAFAQALMAEGSMAAARMHIEQSALLVPDEVPNAETYRDGIRAFAASLPDQSGSFGYFQRVA